MEYLNVTDAALQMGVSVRRIQQMCKNGEIPGAVKKGRSWMIPTGEKKDDGEKKRKPLPIGISDFKMAVEEYYYVDKTLLIRDFLNHRPKVSLFTRPRRFGKTLNMDMFRVFFEKTHEDTSKYFKDKMIWQCGESYTSYQGKYPVIFLSFKDVKCSSWEDTFEQIKELITREYQRHMELETSNILSVYEKEKFIKIAKGDAGNIEYQMSLDLLSRLLAKHNDEKVIIIIDEYDTPIQQGHVCGFYHEVVNFMRNLFSGGLKDNPALAFGFMTGILRVAKESIFSGLNNIAIYSILDSKYSQYFGFTKEEVREILKYYNVNDKYEEVCEWYDGYLFGNTEIFNPWSVINYIENDCFPKAFWQSTGSNDIIGEVIACATPEITEELHKLLSGQNITTFIDTSVIYPEVQNNPYSIYSFLLVAGYLKVSKIYPQHDGNFMCEVGIPNKEISYVYSKEILSKFENVISPGTAIAIQEAIYMMDIPKLQNKLETFLLQTISFHDAANETFYHGLILGLCAMLENKYHITSNREAGKGRFDIQMLPLDKRLPGILIELKALKDCTDGQLDKLAQTALKQIKDRQYYVDMNAQDVNEILQYGIAFSGKSVCIKAEVKVL